MLIFPLDEAEENDEYDKTRHPLRNPEHDEAVKATRFLELP